MKPFQLEFIEYALANNVLRFGEFKLKSGRISPYFFNSGLFNNGEHLSRLGDFYAKTINEHGIKFDTLFGPAYKGIPLVSATAISLSNLYDRAVPYCFDRKEAKDHGEGGLTVGSPLQGNVLIVDDVITAGTSVRYSVDLITKHEANPSGVIIALDRQEKGSGDISAVQEVEQSLGLSVTSIVTMENLIEYLSTNKSASNNLDAILAYKEKYGSD